MNTSALPLPGGQPLLEVVEPNRSPRDERQVDPHPAVPFAGARQVQTEAQRILVHVGNIPPAGDDVYVRVCDEDMRYALPLIFDPHRVLAAQGRRAFLVHPCQARGAKRACVVAGATVPQEQVLLRGREVRPFPAPRHLSVPEIGVARNRRRLGATREAQPARGAHEKLARTARRPDEVGAPVHDPADDSATESLLQAHRDGVDALERGRPRRRLRLLPVPTANMAVQAVRPIVAIAIVVMPPVGSVIPVVRTVIAISIIGIVVAIVVTVMAVMIDAARDHSGSDACPDAPTPSTRFRSISRGRHDG